MFSTTKIQLKMTRILQIPLNSYGEFSFIVNGEMKNIDLNILERIINNPKVVLKDEDQLLDFINRFYSNDSKYSMLYEYVLFQNVEISAINEFLSIYNINDLTSQTWRAVSNRLKQKIDKNMKNIRKSRYRVVVSYIFSLNDITF